MARAPLFGSSNVYALILQLLQLLIPAVQFPFYMLSLRHVAID